MTAPSGRHLSLTKREEIAILRAQRKGVRQAWGSQAVQGCVHAGLGG